MKKLISLIIVATTTLAAFPAENMAKYVFYFIGDGMGMGHVNAAETYNRDVLGSDTPLLMMTFPVASQVRTYSFNSPITDSAAAGTALSTGGKTVNSRVGMTPDSTNMYSITRDFLEAGRRVGVATSVAADDATPAAFYAHALGRHDKYIIAPWAVESGVAFLAGGDFKLLSGGEGNAPEHWLNDMKTTGGYTFVKGMEDYRRRGAEADKVVMTAPRAYWDQIGYTIDSIPDAMRLAEITEACINTTSRGADNGFFIMVEGGNIDWASHANDPGAVIKEILNFQESIRLAYDFYLQHPDETLIVVTADHDTGGMALGRRDNEKTPNLALIDRQRISKDFFGDMCRERDTKGEMMSWEEMKQFLADNLGFWSVIPLSQEETDTLRDSYDRTFVTRDATGESTMYQDYNAFTSDVFDIFSRYVGIGWTTGYHTGNMVPLYAIGAGSSLFTGSLDNTDVPRLIRRAALGH